MAVIVHRVAVLGDGHRHINLLNYQLTVLNVEGHVGEVVVRVREVTGNKAHGISSGVRAAHRRVTTEGEVGSGVQRVGDGHVITAHAVQLTVIVHCVAVLGDGHCHVNRFDYQLTVRHAEGYISEVRVIVNKLGVDKTHRVVAHVGTAGC